MTEDVREEILKDIRDGYIDTWSNLTIEELFEQIEKEHKEIREYRAIGTVKEIKSFFNENRKAGYKHGYSDGYAKAIDESVERFRDWMFEKHGLSQIDISEINEIVEQLKGGAK